VANSSHRPPAPQGPRRITLKKRLDWWTGVILSLAAALSAAKVLFDVVRRLVD
jgi:hypothetical protein